MNIPTTIWSTDHVSALSNFVWGIADVLRGPYKPNQYGSVILPFTILRRLECVMEPHRDVMTQVVGEAASGGYGAIWIANHLRRRTRAEKSPGLSFWNTSAYTLEKALEDPDNLAANLIDYVNGFSADIDVFKNFGFEAQIKELDEHNRLGRSPASSPGSTCTRPRRTTPRWVICSRT